MRVPHRSTKRSPPAAANRRSLRSRRPKPRRAGTASPAARTTSYAAVQNAGSCSRMLTSFTGRPCRASSEGDWAVQSSSTSCTVCSRAGMPSNSTTSGGSLGCATAILRPSTLRTRARGAVCMCTQPRAATRRPSDESTATRPLRASSLVAFASAASASPSHSVASSRSAARRSLALRGAPPAAAATDASSRSRWCGAGASTIPSARSRSPQRAYAAGTSYAKGEKSCGSRPNRRAGGSSRAPAATGIMATPRSCSAWAVVRPCATR
mmetsp:Transcript_3170/g.9138  ORF Transcript_3170/g.9138 Transcript_3170/m.9138 type:complete len:267 (+) Transcript_3170:1466-2266(+)